MKRILLSTLIALTTFSAFAQNVDLRKKIEVTGSAEKEVMPDEIYIGISLKEYLKDNKKKVTIEELEAQLQKAVLKAGIANEDFTINNINAYTNYWDKKKDPTFLASKQYSIKVKDLSKLNQIISAIDPKGIASTNIEKYAYSKQNELQKELEVQAVKDAKSKATRLVEALDSKLWGVLEIRELGGGTPQPIYRNAMLFKADQESMPNIDVKKIKITAQVNVVFEIK